MEARSGPNQGFARPPFTGLRVVVMSNVGSDDSDEASNRAPAAPTPAHPPSASTLATDASPPRSARRDTIASCCSKSRAITRNLREHCPPSAPASFLNYNGGGIWAGGGGTSAVDGGADVRTSALIESGNACSHYPGRDVGFHAATPSCATGEHMFDLSKDVSSGTAAVWLVPIGSFQGQITYYQLGHPEGRVPFGGAGNGHAYLIG